MLKDMSLILKMTEVFFRPESIAINVARINHLEKLNLNFSNKSVFETGCGGIGDITKFLLKYTNNITLNDVRLENIKSNLHTNSVSLKFNTFDLNQDIPDDTKFDIILSYGTLYHLSNPVNFIKNMSTNCTELFILSTVTNGTDNNSISFCQEAGNDQAIDNIGCRPGRQWLIDEFKKYFEFIYYPISQPDHSDFPKHWPSNNNASRFILIASHTLLDNKNLTLNLPTHYI